MAKASSDVLKGISKHFKVTDKILKVIIAGIIATIAACAPVNTRMTRVALDELTKRSDVVRVIYQKTRDPEIVIVTTIEYRSDLEMVETQLGEIYRYLTIFKKNLTNIINNEEIEKFGDPTIPDYISKMFDDINKRLIRLEKKQPGIISKYNDEIIYLKGEWEQVIAGMHCFNAIKGLEILVENIKKGGHWELTPKYFDKYDAELNKGKALRKFRKRVNQYNELKKFIIHALTKKE